MIYTIGYAGCDIDRFVKILQDKKVDILIDVRSIPKSQYFKDFNNDCRYVYKTEKTITKDGLENSSTKLLERGDVIISARGTVGEIASIPYPMAFNQSCYGLRARAALITSDFLYYLLKYNIAAFFYHLF